MYNNYVDDNFVSLYVSCKTCKSFDTFICKSKLCCNTCKKDTYTKQLKSSLT